MNQNADQRCPGCGESQADLVTYDEATRRFVCSVCSWSWRASSWERSIRAEAQWRGRMRISRASR